MSFRLHVLEAAGLVGEVVDAVGAGGIDVSLEVGVEQLLRVEFGAVARHEVQVDGGVEPDPDDYAAVDQVPVGDDVD